jgi:hypothetical protein
MARLDMLRYATVCWVCWGMLLHAGRAVVCCGKLWYVMVCYGFLWYAVVHYGKMGYAMLQWDVIGYACILLKVFINSQVFVI